jgi:hypothetical protein
MVLPVLSELSELYRASDGAATACLLAKLGVEKSLMAKLEDTRQALAVRGAGLYVKDRRTPDCKNGDYAAKCSTRMSRWGPDHHC